MTDISQTPATCARAPARRRIRLATLLSIWRQRRALARMDNAQLRDLGLSRAAALAEARRWPWDI